MKSTRHANRPASVRSSSAACLALCSLLAACAGADDEEVARVQEDELRLSFDMTFEEQATLDVAPTPRVMTTIPLQTVPIPVQDWEITPVFQTVVLHIPFDVAQRECSTWSSMRKRLLEVVALFDSRGVAVNLQADQTFFEGNERCETQDDRRETRRARLLDYLTQVYGIDVDIRMTDGVERTGSEVPTGFADLHAQARRVAGTLSTTLGSFVWSKDWAMEYVQDEVRGLSDRDYAFRPSLLTHGLYDPERGDHQKFRDRSTGVWRPMGGGSDFYQDDFRQVPYIGPGYYDADWQGNGCSIENGLDYGVMLAGLLELERLPSAMIYTSTLELEWSDVATRAGMAEVLYDIDRVQPLVDSGRMVFMTYREVLDAWRFEYGARPNAVRLRDIDLDRVRCR